jgi:hypothetical protein
VPSPLTLSKETFKGIQNKVRTKGAVYFFNVAMGSACRVTGNDDRRLPRTSELPGDTGCL